MIWDDMIWKDETCDFDVIVCVIGREGLGVRRFPDREVWRAVMWLHHIEIDIEIEIDIDIEIEMDTSVGRADDVFTVSICGGGTPYCVVCRGVTPHYVRVEVYTSLICFILPYY